VPLVTACRIDAIDPTRGRAVKLHGREIALFKDGDAIRAIDNTCLHTGGPLAGGPVVDGCVVCPWHGWVYDLATGQKVDGARSAGDLEVYEVVVEGDEVKVQIPDEVRT
jgi:nitrite reductase (NADH) small subunit